MTSLEHDVMTSDGMRLSIVCNTSLTRQESVTSLDTIVTPHGVLGSFSIDDGKGSENVSFKMNTRFFSLCRVYSS